MLRMIKNWTYLIMRHISTNVSPSVSRNVKSYEEAVRTLNTLQSNAATIEKARQERNVTKHHQIPKTIQMAERAGITLDDIDKLSIIHVSGTKGKGSTCAFCESILRSYGYKTGFFSSPHLVEVRERIRIDGKPLSKDAFSNYFWDCYKNLDATKDEHGGEMPPYFKFLTIMAFHVFLQEQVDVAIMEVGIGGEYDCTNIIRSPVACGVSSLGLDHTSILGNTIEKIAWQKAGIFKPGVPAVTVPHEENALKVLMERAVEIGNPLYMSPEFESYKWNSTPPVLGIAGKMQKLNATLAMQLCNLWLENHSLGKEERVNRYSRYIQNKESRPEITPAEKFVVSHEFINGLQDCRWAGRNQVYKRPGITYYIDGAHTEESVEQCSQWFQPTATEEAQGKSGKVAKVLIFNVTGDRDPTSLLQHLKICDFDCAVFCPNIASISVDKARADQCNFTVTIDSQLARCTKCKNAWLQVLSTPKASKLNYTNPGSINVPTGDFCHTKLEQNLATGDHSVKTDFDSQLEIKLADIASSDNERLSRKREHSGSCDEETYNSVSQIRDSGLGSSSKVSTRSTPEHDVMPCYIFPTILDALQWISKGSDPELAKPIHDLAPQPKVIQEADYLQVLCTGSLHLVGGLIGLLDPNINDNGREK